MIKILYLCESLYRGGAEQLLLTTLKYLDRAKFSAVVCCISKKGEVGREIEGLGFKIIELNRKLHIANLAAIFGLVRVLRKEKPDILHTHLYFANIFGRLAAKLAGIKSVITTLHNPDYSYEDNGKFTYKIRKAIDKYTGRFCNKGFIAVSGFVKNDFEKQLGFKNISILYNYLDMQRFVEGRTQEIRQKRQELGIAYDDTLILNVGRLHPQKGQGRLIEAFAMLHKAQPNTKLVIVGKGRLKDELKNTADSLSISKSVIFLEERSDVPQIMSACDIFVFPSSYEGFGIAMIEAMACGRPVVASDIAPLNEIARGGLDAILCESNNPRQLERAISSLIQDKKQRIYLGENARNRVKELFDASRQVKNLEQIYFSSIQDDDNNYGCIVCGANTFRNTIYGGYCYSGKKYNIVKCRECGFMFLSPKPSEDILTSIYANDDYFQDYYATQDGLKDYIEGMRDYDHNDNLILNLISGYKKGGRLLDIGCAAGRFLKNARQAGFDVFGIEPNKRLAAYAKDAFGLEVECATLDNAHLEKESFDVIYAADVIEHLPDLQNSMDLIKALLNKDGILVINQPLSYNRSFFNLLLKLNMLLKTSRCSQNPPTHLWEFTPMTLRRFLKNNGFKVVYFETSESMPKPFRIMNFRDCLRFYIKKISAAISNSRYLERLYLGDRGIVICKK